MARFLKHAACPVCGSSDALAHYSDGSTYCYSHGKSTKRASITPYIASSQALYAEDKPIALPNDVTQEYPPQALEWTGKYEISVTEMLRSNIYYSRARNQVIFTFVDGEGKLLAYQARNLSAESKTRRYYTQGDINNVLPIYRSRDACGDSSCSMVRKLTLVEDCLSAIKIASLVADSTSEKPLGFDSMPCLGSGIPLLKLTRLRPFYDVLDVFLDPDMWHHSLKIVQQAQMLGFTARAIRADCDPKELSRETLCQLLK